MQNASATRRASSSRSARRRGIAVVGTIAVITALAGLAGGAVVASAKASVAGAAAASASSLWSSGTTPLVLDSSDPNPVELGVRFTPTVSGSITGVRFYKAATNTGTHTASLWTASGSLLGTATFVGETASGWQQVTFASPVPVSANSTYIASYHAPAGHYSVDEYYFDAAHSQPPLLAPASTASAGNGVYEYGASAFPNLTYRASNYWVDPLFVASAPPTTTTTATSTTTTTTATTTTTTPPAGTPTTFPAAGTVGAKGTLTDVYPAGGVMSIHTPTVLSNVKIHGGLDIYANTELHNVYVEQSGTWWGNIVVRNNASLLAEDCTVKPLNVTPNDARKQDGVLDVAASSITIERCDISIAGKGALIGSNTTIDDSWFHDFTPYLDPSTGAWTHKDCVMTMGGSNMKFVRDNFAANNPTPYDATTNPTGFDSHTQTAAILLQPWSAISNVAIQNSFLEGGYYALRMQAVSPSGGAATGLNGLVVTNNVFGPYPTGGGYYTYDPLTQIASWSGNVAGDINGNATKTAIPQP